MKNIKITLGTSKNTNERYTLISGQMGSANTPLNHINRIAEITSSGGIMAVSYFLTKDYIEQPLKDKVIKFCESNNLVYNH